MDNKRLFLRHHDQSICRRHTATIETTNQKAKPTNKPTHADYIFPKSTTQTYPIKHGSPEYSSIPQSKSTNNKPKTQKHENTQKHTKHKTQKTQKTTYHRRKCLWGD
mmetsp:Transcript_15986/g.40654  ORF Transcript_15986/g.40654 Transcript_15986/m.40654 type:complete len:107 (-) Transcript_15986:15-335(-)